MGCAGGAAGGNRSRWDGGSGVASPRCRSTSPQPPGLGRGPAGAQSSVLAGMSCGSFVVYCLLLGAPGTRELEGGRRGRLERKAEEFRASEHLRVAIAGAADSH